MRRTTAAAMAQGRVVTTTTFSTSAWLRRCGSETTSALMPSTSSLGRSAASRGVASARLLHYPRPRTSLFGDATGSRGAAAISSSLAFSRHLLPASSCRRRQATATEVSLQKVRRSGNTQCTLSCLQIYFFYLLFIYYNRIYIMFLFGFSSQAGRG
jgi:hypothetical protein